MQRRRRADVAADRQRRAELVTSVAERRRRQWCVDEAGRDKVDADGRELERRVLEALRVAAGEDDVGSLCACSSGCLESDFGAATDHDDGLPEALGFSRRRRDSGCGGHAFLRRSV